jgi:voltage-dependent anion channel protein 2
MAPTKFGDIGKSASDLLSDDFGASSSKLVVKTKADNGTEVKVQGTRNNASGAVSGFVETKTNYKGFAITEKWSNDNTINTEVSHKCPVFKGGKHTFYSTFKPAVGGFQGISGLKLKSALPCSTANTNLAFTAKDVTVDSSTNFGKWIVGGSAKIGCPSFAVSNVQFAAGFTDGNLSLATKIVNGDKVSTSIYHSAGCCDYKIGVNFGWTRSSGATNLELAAKHSLDDSSYVKAKLNANLDLGVAYVHNLSKCTKAKVAADISAAKESKIGFTLEFNA